MNWLIRCLSSSVGKKIVMGITGLLLCGFLVVHLAGNFLMFAGAEPYNAYAHKLHSLGGLLVVAEVLLLLLFIAHVTLAFVTTLENRAARKHNYAVKQSKRDEPLLQTEAHNWMFISGAVVLCFIILHLLDFRFEFRLPGPEDEAPFDKALRILQNPITIAGYLVGVTVLGFHLVHGFSSAFQSIGINHPKYNRLIECIGVLFAIVIALGFASLPLWAFLFKH